MIKWFKQWRAWVLQQEKEAEENLIKDVIRASKLQWTDREEDAAARAIDVVRRADKRKWYT